MTMNKIIMILTLVSSLAVANAHAAVMVKLRPLQKSDYRNPMLSSFYSDKQVLVITLNHAKSEYSYDVFVPKGATVDTESRPMTLSFKSCENIPINIAKSETVYSWKFPNGQIKWLNRIRAILPPENDGFQRGCLVEDADGATYPIFNW